MPIFQTISSAYIEELIRKLRPKLFIPNVYITKEGNLGNEMYFIVKGKLSVIIEGLHINTLQDGQFFGEIALLLKSSRRTASVKTKSFVDLFYLTKWDFD
jgi:CRP-like cAMP-binding protein